MILFHGEHTVTSRQALVKTLDKLRETHEIFRVEAGTLTRAKLEDLLGTQSLFGSKQALVIEGLHSLPHSKKRNELISLLAESSYEPLLLWEQKKLTKTQVKKLAPTKEEYFPLSKALFAWLESIGTNMPTTKQRALLLQALDQDDEYFCMIMLARQIRLLLLIKSGGKIPGPGFMQNKLISQAKFWSIDQLKKLHTTILEHDVAFKTGKSKISWKVILDLAIIGQ